MAAVAIEDEVWAGRRQMVEDLLAELERRGRSAGDPRPVELIETHISWVLLGPEVYKIKKPVILPFVDFSSFEAREQACRTEVRINRRLAPRTYVGVVPIRRTPRGAYTFGSVGPIVEWAVRMVRLDERHRADVLLAAQGPFGGREVDALAVRIAAFHAECPSTPRIARCGAPEAIERNVSDNFAAFRDAGDTFASRAMMDEIEAWQMRFLEKHRDRFEQRMIEGAIRDGHGDLRLEHVFCRGTEDVPEFDVIDGIEFDDRYRYGDVAADVAFLAMDLTRSGRVDLAERFLATYARAANDFDLYGVLDFYEAYRATVRAKIAAAVALGRWTPADVRQRAAAEARRYLLLAQSAPRALAVPPVVVAVAGGIASGKTTLADRLAWNLGAPIVDADRTRKHMLGLVATDHVGHGKAWEGPYAPAFSEKVYAEVLRRAAVVIGSGRPVILDASFRTPEARAAARHLANAHGVPFRLLECVAPLEVCRRRLEARQADRANVSDATPELLESFAAHFQPITELPEVEHARIDTSGDITAALEEARGLLATWPRGLVQ